MIIKLLTREVFIEILTKNRLKLFTAKRYKLTFVMQNPGHFEYLSVRDLVNKFLLFIWLHLLLLFRELR